MSQRNSGYAKKPLGFYETPEWVTEALLPHIPYAAPHVWEPAVGSGKMCRVLERVGAIVFGSDITTGTDFLETEAMPDDYNIIVTNPPFHLAQEFCEHALALTRPRQGFVAMLLRTDFDHAKTRAHLFRDHPAFAKKLVLLKRIVWFVEANGKPKASPSFNHAWFMWSWLNKGLPTIAYQN